MQFKIFISVNYTFEITPNHGNYDECRLMCLKLGGDLIYKNFGSEGKHYWP